MEPTNKLRGKGSSIFCRDPLDDITLEMWNYVEQMMYNGAQKFKNLQAEGIQFVFGSSGSRPTN